MGQYAYFLNLNSVFEILNQFYIPEQHKIHGNELTFDIAKTNSEKMAK